MPFRFLKTYGLLGINARNLLYIRPFNPGKAIAFADSKLKTKAFLEARGIPVPRLYAKIRSRRELRHFDFAKLPDSCVLKPNFGYGGEGIRVLLGRRDGEFYDDRGIVTERDLIRHIEDILDAKYAISHTADVAYFEQRLIPHDTFTALKPQGMPDVRIVVFNLVPVMAMLRIPTRESFGKANVHLGGIGLGIDLAKGTTTYATQYNRILISLPDGADPKGHAIPRFQDLLLIASRVQQITNIGFLAVDLTLDKEDGPMLLEVNARSGLMVQVANLAPLRSRLERVQGLRVTTPEKGVRLAMDLFGGERVEEVRGEGKPVLGTRETVEIQGRRRTIRAVAVLRPDHDRTVFDPSLIEELRALGAVEPIEMTPEGGLFHVKMIVGGKRLQTVVSPHQIRERGARISLGRRDLTSFLLDPGRQVPPPPVGGAKDMLRVDHQLAEVDRKIRVLRALRPGNLDLEREKAMKDERYNPQLMYTPLDFDPDDLLDRLSYLRGDDSPLGILLEKKRTEIIQKISMLRSRGDAQAFVACSSNLYGRPTPALLSEARRQLHSWKGGAGRGLPLIPASRVQGRLEEVLREYGLHDWQVKLCPSLVADCAIGRNVLLLRQGAEFSEERVRSLIAHEIETHILTTVNGEKQPYDLLRVGCAGYLETQEGLAIVNQNRLLPADHEKRAWPALGVVALHYAFTHSFAETRSFIRHLGFDDRRALRTCFKVKRGLRHTSDAGAFTRELLYFRGMKLVQEFLAKGGEMRKLYVGKIHVPDIELVEKVEGLVPPAILPWFLQERKDIGGI
jgi:alpha-L-glutamate ligase-like protein/uncharacterized protein (TIGR02421 family)